MRAQGSEAARAEEQRGRNRSTTRQKRFASPSVDLHGVVGGVHCAGGVQWLRYGMLPSTDVRSRAPTRFDPLTRALFARRVFPFALGDTDQVELPVRGGVVQPRRRGRPGADAVPGAEGGGGLGAVASGRGVFGGWRGERAGLGVEQGAGAIEHWMLDGSFVCLFVCLFVATEVTNASGKRLSLLPIA